MYWCSARQTDWHRCPCCFEWKWECLPSGADSAFFVRCTMQAAHRPESAAYWSAGYIVWDCGRQAERPGAVPEKRQWQTGCQAADIDRTLQDKLLLSPRHPERPSESPYGQPVPTDPEIQQIHILRSKASFYPLHPCWTTRKVSTGSNPDRPESDRTSPHRRIDRWLSAPAGQLPLGKDAGNTIALQDHSYCSQNQLHVEYLQNSVLRTHDQTAA